MKDIAFRLGAPYANEFVRFARAFIDQKNPRMPVCAMAYGRIDGRILYVRGTDWVRAFELALPLLSASVEHGEFLLSPPAGLFDKRSAYVEVTAGADATTYRSLSDSITLSVEEGNYPNLDSVWELKPANKASEKLETCFSPSLLASSLKAFDQKLPVKLTFTTDRAPVLITQGSAKAIVLPVRNPDKAAT